MIQSAIMRKHILFLLLLAVVLLPACNGYDLKKRSARFEKEIAPFREKMENVGMSVVFVRENKIVYVHHFGVKNIDTQEPIDDETMFRIASISKSFTATSLMQLVEQGVVSLNTDVSELAGFPIRNPKFPDTVITLEMLMSHTSSLNDSEGYFTLDVINPESNPDYANCYNDYEPGKGYEYCNLNFNLCGTFLEKLSGERFDQYVVHHILNPLGLYGGYCVDSLDTSRFASLYQWDGERFECVDEDAYDPRSERIANYRFGYDAPLFSPTGGMKLSAISLAKYMLMHMNYGITPDSIRIISEASSKNMQTPRSDDEHYGLALWKTDLYSPGVVLTGHTGGAYGMRSAMFFDPEEKYGFVVISNGARDIEETDEANILIGTLSRMYTCFVGE